MRLPEKLSSHIEELAKGISQVELARAAQALSHGYRQDSLPPAIRTEAERIAYLLVRMPATYAAIRAALGEVAARTPNWRPKAMLDLGSGPGTALWAASDTLGRFQKIVAIEREPALRELGESLSTPLGPSIEWSTRDLRTWKTAGEFDLVLASYALGELPADIRQRVILKAWEACSGVLVVVEPGTRRGFDVIVGTRNQLISLGTTIAAPCPHAFACPMKQAGDWCHFSTRVERTSLHRRLKQGDLGYEDEKFSYVAASRMEVVPASARIVRHPQRYSGHVKLQLCAKDGLREVTVTRSQKELYRAVKRAEWGSGWDGS